MRKTFYIALPLAFVMLGFVSCVDEMGPGVAQPKSMYLEYSEYTIDPEDTGGTFVLRWVDVTNATYSVSFSNDDNDYVQVLTNDQIPGDLSTFSMDIPHSQIFAYADVADIQPDDYGRVNVNVDVTGTPIDLSLPTALSETGSTATTVVHIGDVIDEGGDDGDSEE